MILLVHSCEGREWIVDHWREFFAKSGWDAEAFFISSNREFSDQLIDVLEYFNQVEYLWYTLDDYWIIDKIEKLGRIYFDPKLPFWYIDGTEKGVLTKKGRQHVNES